MKQSKKKSARDCCNDCGINVIKAGEYYMLQPDIWHKQLGMGSDDNLCVGCLEQRLGRKVSTNDMCGLPIFTTWKYPPSLRLMHRLIGNRITKRPPCRLRKQLRNFVSLTCFYGWLNESGSAGESESDWCERES